MFECYMCSLTMAAGNLIEASQVCIETIQKIIDYYEGNEQNELIAEPLIILASIQLQTQQIEEAYKTGQRAERIVKEMNGELSEKLLEIY